jgi:biopolymer transport protein ExbB
VHRDPDEQAKDARLFAKIGNVATLFGLWGTVWGLISCFAAVRAVDPATKATILALGISRAMNFTAFGLVIAIPSVLVYSALTRRR